MSSSGAVNRGHIPRRCVNCSFVVPRQQRVHCIDELSNSMLNVLSAWIAPGSVLEDPPEAQDDVPLILGLNNYLIRGRIKSRHVSGRTYFTYILVSRDTDVADTLNALVGYCCNCLVGKRTVGCCAHIMTVVWYLSWGRFNDIQAPAPFLDDIFDEDI